VEAELGQGVVDPASVRRIGQVGGEDLCSDPVLARQFVGEGSESVLTAGDEGDAQAAVRQLAGDLRADA
jgi:hypothetical protein